MAVAVRRIPPALSWRLVRQASSRLTWGVADQGMSTLTNFALSILVARTLGAAQFGAFSLAYVTYGFAINASRGLSIEPLLIRFSGTDLRTWRRATAGSTGTALVVGLATGTCALTAGALVGGTTGLAFLALGLTLPGLLLQDSWRYAFFALGRGHHAFINDTIWAAIQIPALLLLKLSGHATVFWFVLAWGVSAAIGAAVGSLQARVVPDPVGATQWLVRHRDLGPRYLAENTGGNAADTLRGYGVSYILGLAAVGYVQAAGVLMGPFKILFFGMGMITIPEAARILRRSPRHLPLYCVGVSTGLTVLALVWGVVLLVALPHGLGHLMLGSLWRPTYPLVLPATPVHHGHVRLDRRGYRPARPGGRAPQPARRDPHLGARCRLRPRGSRDRRHARHDALLRGGVVARHAGVLVAVAAGVAGVGHRPRTRLVVAAPLSGQASQGLRG